MVVDINFTKNENKLATILLASVISVLLASAAEAAYPTVGIVNNASDGTPANGHTAIVYHPGYKSEAISDLIGPLGNSKTDNWYLIDCELIIDSCEVGDVLLVEVTDNGDGYVAGPVSLAVTGNGFDQAPSMTLIKFECDVGTYKINVFTDKVVYEPGENVTITGSVVNSACDPVLSGEVAMQVSNPSSTEIFAGQADLSNGAFLTTFTLPGDASEGQYTVYSNFEGENATTTFSVECNYDNDGDNYISIQCGGNDCDDNNADIHLGAAETCGNGIDENCDGVDDTCPVSSQTTGGSSIGGGCSANWTCSEWSPCSSQGIQTRVCTDQKKCGTTANKPAETQSCTYTPPAPPAPPAVCGDGSCNGDESCSTCEQDCGVCPQPPAVCGNNKCEEGEDCSNCAADCGACATTSNPSTTGDLTGLLIGNPAVSGGFIILIAALGLLTLFAIKRRGGKKKGYSYVQNS
jgi:hypothetical protein